MKGEISMFPSPPPSPWLTGSVTDTIRQEDAYNSINLLPRYVCLKKTLGNLYVCLNVEWKILYITSFEKKEKKQGEVLED